METTLTLDRIQYLYEKYEAHAGIQAINKAIDKVLATGKKEYELANGNIARQWINSNHEVTYNELVESRKEIINREFSEIKSLLLNQ